MPVGRSKISAGHVESEEQRAYEGDGDNHWPAAHVLDNAHLYRLAIEKAEPGANYHAVAEALADA
jgi:hypothetical protein